MAEPDIARIKRNIGKMIDAGAPESDIDAYVAGEGTTPEQLRTAGTDTSIINAPAAGASALVSGVGKTLKNLGATETGAALEATGAKLGPGPRYKSGGEDFMNKGGEGFNWSAAPRAVVEGAPGLAADIAAAKIGSRFGGVPGMVIGGLGSYMLRSTGETQNKRAAEHTGNPNAEPTTEDKLMGAGTSAVEGAINAIPLGRFVNPAKISGVGLKGVGETALEVGKRAGLEGVTSGAQSAVNQAGTTIDTPGGVRVDGKQVLGDAILGAGTGGAMSTGHAIKGTVAATKFRDMGGDNTVHSEAVANRVLARVGGDAEALNNPKESYRAVTEVHSDIRNELSAATKGLDLSPDASNAVERAKSGGKLTGDDLKAIDSTGNDGVIALARQANVLNTLTSKGQLDSRRERFAGGAAEKVRSVILNHPYATLGAGGAAAALGKGAAGIDSLVAAAPGLAATGLAGAGGYLALSRAEKALGIRSPAKSFVEKFANGQTPVRPAVTPEVRAPQNPTGPRIAQVAPSPWGPPAPFVSRDEKRIRGLEDAIGAKAAASVTADRKVQEREATRLDQSADRGADYIGRSAVAQIRGERRIQAMRERQALQEQTKDATGLVQARKGNLKLLTEDATQTVQAKRANDTLQRRGDAEQKTDARELMAARQSPNALDRAQMADARELTAARRAHEKLQRDAERAEAQAADAKSHIGDDNAISPSTLSAAQKLVKSLTAVQKIKAKVEKAEAQIVKKQETQAKAAERTQAKAERDAVKEAKALAKATKPKANGKVNGHTTTEEAPKSNGKANGHDPLHTLDEAPWAYADDNAAAAKMVLDHELKYGRDISNPSGYLKSTERRLNDIEALLAGTMQDATTNAQKSRLSEAVARLKSARSRAQAVEYREAIKSALPELAASIEKNFSDSRINAIWKKGT